jgi:superoxide dismutase
LPYDPAALEPHIDAQTMKLHHDIVTGNFQQQDR